MPTKNVNLTDYYTLFVDDLIESGRYNSASEVLCAGLRLLEQRTTEEEQKLALLRNLAVEGFAQIDQGQGIELPSQRHLSDHIAKLGRQAAKSVSGQTSD